MKFLVDKTRKIIFGWTPKCGCSHVKRIYYYLTENNEDPKIHTRMDEHDISKINLADYEIIIVMRNPYDRLVSGFLEKYRFDGPFIELWPTNIKLNFTNFVEQLLNNNFNVINQDHFARQLSEFWDPNIAKQKGLHVYDLSKISYTYIESLYAVPLPERVLNKREGHEQHRRSIDMSDKPIYDMLQSEYMTDETKPQTRNFYTREMADKVKAYFADDFEFARAHGLEYTL